MKKIHKVDANASDIIYQGTDAKCVEIYAFAKDENDDEITLGCEMIGDDQQIFVYDGIVNTSDPGEGPTEEYEDCEKAIASEYGYLFKAIFDLADSMK